MFLQMPSGFKPRFENFALYGFLDETMREGAERCPFSIPQEKKVGLALRILKSGVRDIIFGSGPDDPENIAALVEAVQKDGSIGSRWSASFILLLNCWEPIYQKFTSFPEEGKDNVIISLAMLDYQKDKRLFERVVEKFRAIGFHNFRVSLLNNFKRGVDELTYGQLIESIDRSVALGITAVRINDSLGEIFPETLAVLCANLTTSYPDIHFCLHAHDDRGLGLQNALTSIYHGFDIIESAFAGFGNRSGLPAIETLSEVFREKNIKIEGVDFTRSALLETSKDVEDTFLTVPHVYRPTSGMIVDWENMGVANIPDYLRSERDARQFLNDVGLHPQTITSLLTQQSISYSENLLPIITEEMRSSLQRTYSQKRQQYEDLIERLKAFYSDGIVFEADARDLASNAYAHASSTV